VGSGAIAGGSLDVATGAIAGGSLDVGSGAIAGGSLNVGSGAITGGSLDVATGAIAGGTITATGAITGASLNAAHLNAISPANNKNIVSLRGYSSANDFTLPASPDNSSYLIGNITPQDNNNILNNCIVLGDGELETAYNSNTCVYGNASMERHVFKGIGGGDVVINMQTRQIEGLLKDDVELSENHVVIGTLPDDIEDNTKNSLLNRVKNGSIILGPSNTGQTGGILNTILPSPKEISNCILLGPKVLDDVSSAETIIDTSSGQEVTRYVNSCILGNRQTTRVVANGGNPIVLDTAHRKINEMSIDSLTAGDSGSVLIGPHSRDYPLLGEMYRTAPDWMKGVPNVLAVTNNYMAVGTTHNLYVSNTWLNRSADALAPPQDIVNFRALDATDEYLFAANDTEYYIYTVATQYPVIGEGSFRAVAIDAEGTKLFYSTEDSLYSLGTVKDASGNIEDVQSSAVLLNLRCDQLKRLGPILIGLVRSADNKFHIYAWNTINVNNPQSIDTAFPTTNAVMITAEQLSTETIIIAVANITTKLIKLYSCVHNPVANTITSLNAYSSLDLQSTDEIYNMTFVLNASFNPSVSVLYDYLAISTRQDNTYNIDFLVYEEPEAYAPRITSLEKVIAFAINPSTNLEIVGIIDDGNNGGQVRVWNTMRPDVVTYSNYNYSTVISNKRPANILKDSTKTSQLNNSILIGPMQPGDIPDSTIQNYVCSNAVILGNQETTRVAFNASSPITLRTDDRYFDNLKQLARYELQDNLATGAIKPPGNSYFSNTGFGATFDGYYTAIPWISDGMLYTMPESYLCVSLGQRAGATVTAGGNLAGSGGVPNKTFIAPWGLDPNVLTTRPAYSFMINLEVMRQRTNTNATGSNNATGFTLKYVDHCQQTISIPDTSIYIDNTGAAYLHAHTPKAAQDFMAIMRVCSIKIYKVLWWLSSSSVWNYTNIEIGFYRYARFNPDFCRIVYVKAKPKVGLSWFAFTSVNIPPYSMYRDVATNSTISVMPHVTMTKLDASLTLATTTKFLTLCDSRFTTSTSTNGRRQWRFLPFSFKHTDMISATFMFKNGATRTWTRAGPGNGWSGNSGSIETNVDWRPGYFTGTIPTNFFYITSITTESGSFNNVNLVPTGFRLSSNSVSNLSFLTLSDSEHELNLVGTNTHIKLYGESFVTQEQAVNTTLTCELRHTLDGTRLTVPFQSMTAVAVTPTCILHMASQFTTTSMTITTPSEITIQQSGCLLYQLSYLSLPCVASYYVYGKSTNNQEDTGAPIILWTGVILWCQFDERDTDVNFTMPNTHKFFSTEPDLIYRPLAGSSSSIGDSTTLNGNIRITFPAFSLGYSIDSGTLRPDNTSSTVDPGFSGYRLDVPFFTSHKNLSALLVTYASVHDGGLDGNSVNETSPFLKIVTTSRITTVRQSIAAIHKHFPDHNGSSLCVFVREAVYTESYLTFPLKIMQYNTQFRNPLE
jgi:hypothetical protein